MVRRPAFIAVALFIVAAGFMPATAGVVTVGTVSATQYSYPWFGATVYAYSTVNLADAHLVVETPEGETVLVVPDEVKRYVLDGQGNYVQWNFVKYATGVVKPGDALTAVVSDVEAATDDHTVPCTTGSTKKKSKETAVCK